MLNQSSYETKPMGFFCCFSFSDCIFFSLLFVIFYRLLWILFFILWIKLAQGSDIHDNKWMTDSSEHCDAITICNKHYKGCNFCERGGVFWETSLECHCESSYTQDPETKIHPWGQIRSRVAVKLYVCESSVDYNDLRRSWHLALCPSVSLW